MDLEDARTSGRQSRETAASREDFRALCEGAIALRGGAGEDGHGRIEPCMMHEYEREVVRPRWTLLFRGEPDLGVEEPRSVRAQRAELEREGALLSEHQVPVLEPRERVNVGTKAPVGVEEAAGIEVHGVGLADPMYGTCLEAPRTRFGASVVRGKERLMLVDTHCHLDPQYLPDGPDVVLARARAAGVGGFVTIGVGHDAGAAREAVALAEKLPECVAATAGVHPHDAGTMTPTIYDEIAALAARREVVAVGEVGLDYHYDSSPRDVQREVFARFVGLAKHLGKPLVIHTREAAADTLEVLDREGARAVGGIIHCFSEDRAFAERALAMGFFLSFSGIVTFKSAQSVHDVAAWAPADRILVETDSPYLAPVPLRGKPCEPAYLVHTAKRVAALRNISIEELTHLTTTNATRVFGRAFPTA